MVFLIAAALIPLIALIAFSVATYRRVGSGAESWAADRNLSLDNESRAMVARHLRTSRVLRVLGAIAGIVLVPLIAKVGWDQNLEGAYQWLAAIGGYLAGIVLAEIVLRRPSGRSASIRPRRLSEYLSPHAARSQRIAAAFAAVVALSAAVVAARPASSTSPWTAAAIGLGVLVVLFGSEAVQRWLISRPQPFVSQSLTDADDAIRQQSVRSIAGAEMGMQLLLAGAALWMLALSDIEVLRWTMWPPALMSWIAALIVCARYERPGKMLSRPRRVGPAS